MKDKDKIYKRKILFMLVFAVGFCSSALGVLISFILAKLNIFSSFEYFMSLPLFIQILFITFYFVLWLILFYVFYKEIKR